MNKVSPEPGCYIDSHQGHYAIPGVIRLAGDRGYTIDPIVAFVLGKYESDHSTDEYPHEELIFLSEEAIDWLNNNDCPEGHCWSWNDGDFGLYPIDEDEA